MTYLEMVNEILRRLREEEVSAVNTDDRGAMIGAFVNLAKDEIESAWNWTVLRQDLSISTVAATATAYLTGSSAGTRFIKNEEAVEGYNVTSKSELHRAPIGWIDRQRFLGGSSSGPPRYFSVIGRNTSTDELQLRLFPTPDDTYTLTFPVVVPQAKLTSDDTNIAVPWRPVVERAYLYAMMERGEDQGNLSDFQARLAKQVLTDAIGNDSEKVDDETIWVPR